MRRRLTVEMDSTSGQDESALTRSRMKGVDREQRDCGQVEDHVPGGDAPDPARPAWVVEKARHRGHECADDATDDVPEGQRSPQRIAGDSLHDVEREGRDPDGDVRCDAGGAADLAAAACVISRIWVNSSYISRCSSIVIRDISSSSGGAAGAGATYLCVGLPNA
jgi:hypothetical protein